MSTGNLSIKIEIRKDQIRKAYQRFSQRTSSKMVAKESDSQKNEESNKEVDEEKIRTCMISLMKKDTPNPRKDTANNSASSATSMISRLRIEHIQATTSALALKSVLVIPETGITCP